MAVPWVQIVQWVPSVLELSRRVLQQTRQSAALPEPDPDDPLSSRVAALEDNQRRVAELLRQLAEHTSQLAIATAALHKQMRWMLGLQTIVLVAVLASLLGGCNSRRDEETPATYQLAPVVRGGSPFHGIHGLRFDRDGTLYAASVIGQSIFRVDVQTGRVEQFIGPPQGMADDLAIGPDGTFVWTAIEDGILYARAPDGTIRKLMENQRGVNAVSFSPDGKRLFATLVFYGDALYEVDLTGGRPPRLVVDKPGGLNAFEVGDDGMIYGPLVFGKRVVKIDPDRGTVTTIAELENPGALKLDFKGAAYVLNNDRELRRLELATGRSTIVANLPFGADNLDLDTQGQIYVSLSEVNAIVRVDPETGEQSYVVPPAELTSATGLAAVGDAAGDRLYLGDLFGGVRQIDASTGAVEKIPVDLFQPAHLSLTDDHLLVVGQVFGVMQQVDRQSYAVLRTWDKLDFPADALEAANGEIVVAEMGTGSVLRLRSDADDRRVLAQGLAGPNGLAWTDAGEGPQSGVYVSETNGGRLLRIALADGTVTVVAEGLAQPEGIALDADGSILVMEVGAKRLTRIHPADGRHTIVADTLPVGYSNGPSLYRSVAVTPRAIYFNSDTDNAVYKLTPVAN